MEVVQPYHPVVPTHQYKPSDCLAKISQSPSLLSFYSNASLSEGFALLKVAVPGNGCITTSAKVALESDESSSYGLEVTFVLSRERLCRVAEEGH